MKVIANIFFIWFTSVSQRLILYSLANIYFVLLKAEEKEENNVYFFLK